MGRKILAINPGSTSTKIAIFDENTCIFEETVRHSNEELAKFNSVFDQFEYRKDIIIKSLNNNSLDLNELVAVVGRGGIFVPMKSGTYLVNDAMLKMAKEAPRGEHASNLGCVIAFEIAKSLNINAYIVDPVCVDELDDIARISGIAQIERTSLFHALNQKAVAKRYARDLNTPYNELNLIVAHLGGGVSVGVHRQGSVCDVNNALDGDGPMSPERSGSVPIGGLYRLIFEDGYTYEEIKSLNVGGGGFVSHLGTNNGLDVVERIEQGDTKAKLVFDAMCYQVSKEIAAGSAVLFGKVDAIIITGGLAYNTDICNNISERVSFIAPVKIYPGEDELEALVEGVFRVLDGSENVMEFKL